LSKLADKIKSVTRVSAAPIGFGAAKAAKEPTMLLAGLARDAKEAAEMARRGADAVVVAGARPDAARDLAGTIAGVAIAGKSDDEARRYREGGFDFVVFDPNQASAAALLDDKAGYVLTLPKDLEDNEIRTLEAFQLDAIDIGMIDGSLTVRRQIELRRVFAMARKPLWARVRGDLSAPELQALRDTNVVVVAADRADDIERLRKTIDALPPRARRREGEERPTALVPRTAAAEEEEEEEEGE
jgi:hypothetical protein